MRSNRPLLMDLIKLLYRFQTDQLTDAQWWSHPDEQLLAPTTNGRGGGYLTLAEGR